MIKATIRIGGRNRGFFLDRRLIGRRAKIGIKGRPDTEKYKQCNDNVYKK